MIIADESLFDDAFIPDRLVSRDGHIKEIARCLNPAKSGRSIRSVFLYGKSGTGKTIVCKWILKEHFARQSVYVNCWSNRTSQSVGQHPIAVGPDGPRTRVCQRT